MSIIGILCLVLSLGLAIIIGVYVGNLIRNRRQEKDDKVKNG